MGFIENNKALCMLSVLINTHLLMAAKEAGVRALFLCVVRLCLQRRQAARSQCHRLEGSRRLSRHARRRLRLGKALQRTDVPAFPRGLSALTTRVARYHNVYGPQGTWDGGREKAPAAVCRKVIQAKLSGKHEIEIWGDGQQTRSFMYIDDCLKGVEAILASDILEPINLGSSELVTHQSIGRHRRGNRRD